MSVCCLTPSYNSLLPSNQKECFPSSLSLSLFELINKGLWCACLCVWSWKNNYCWLKNSLFLFGTRSDFSWCFILEFNTLPSSNYVPKFDLLSNLRSEMKNCEYEKSADSIQKEKHPKIICPWWGKNGKKGKQVWTKVWLIREWQKTKNSSMSSLLQTDQLILQQKFLRAKRESERERKGESES